jgi:hypothetical protein
MGTAEGNGWRLQLPAGAYAVRVSAPPECSSMTHLRGEIAAGAPCFGVVSTRARGSASAAELAAKLAEAFVQPNAPRGVLVEGSRNAARVDGLIDMEEGLSHDGIERIAILVAELSHEFIVLTIRTRPCDIVESAVDAVITSFSIAPVA